MSNGLLAGAHIAFLALGLSACRTTEDPDVIVGGDAADRGTPVDTGGVDAGPMVDVQRVDGQDVPAIDTPIVPTDGGRTATIRQIQDLADPMHPAPGGNVTVNQAGMVALTGRVLIGSRNGDSMNRCRFAFWAGSGMTGDFTGIQVQELINLGDAGDCFGTTPNKIPVNLAVGDSIVSITNGNYGEFCAGPTGIDRTMCRNFEQAQLFVGASASQIMRGAAGSPPPATMATPAEVGQVASAGAPGTRALALEGGLVTVTGRVNVSVTMNDAGTFSDFTIVDGTDTTRSVALQISNFPGTSCARDFLTSQMGMTATVTGILLPDFGIWKLRLRDESDIVGAAATCVRPDGGVRDSGAALDAGTGG